MTEEIDRSLGCHIERVFNWLCRFRCCTEIEFVSEAARCSDESLRRENDCEDKDEYCDEKCKKAESEEIHMDVE